MQAPDFIRQQVQNASDFSRQRTLTFERVALFFLQGASTSLKFGMQKLLQSLSGVEIFDQKCAISRQAVSKACRKFPYQAFAALQKQSVDTFYQHARTPRWMGFRLVGVDGSKVRLPATEAMAEAFGEQGNGKQSRPMALLMGHVDVLAGIPLSGELSPCYMGERFLAERLTMKLV